MAAKNKTTKTKKVVQKTETVDKPAKTANVSFGNRW